MATQEKNTDGGFAQIPHNVWEDERLSGTDVRVMLAVLKAAKQERQCSPTNADIKKSVHTSCRTVQRSLNALEDAGYIRMVDPDKSHRIIHLNFGTGKGKTAPQTRDIHVAPHDTGVMPPRHQCHTPMTSMSRTHDTSVIPHIEEEQENKNQQTKQEGELSFDSQPQKPEDQTLEPPAPVIPSPPPEWDELTNHVRAQMPPGPFALTFFSLWSQSAKVRGRWQEWPLAAWRDAVFDLADVKDTDKHNLPYYLSIVRRLAEQPKAERPQTVPYRKRPADIPLPTVYRAEPREIDPNAEPLPTAMEVIRRMRAERQQRQEVSA